MEIKNCPYCGEEILATAKKCKHCGEWLEEKTTQTVAETSSTSITQFNYTWLAIACWAAMFFAIISTVQDMDIANARGRYESLVRLANLIPEWLVIICVGALDVYFFLGLRQYAIANSKSKGIPFIPYIVLIIGMCVFSLIVSFIDFGNMDAVVPAVLMIVVLILWAITLIMQFIVGLKLKNRLQEASNIGIVLMACGIIPVLLIIISFGTTGDVQSWIYLGGGICSIVLYSYLKNFFTKLNKTN